MKVSKDVKYDENLVVKLILSKEEVEAFDRRIMIHFRSEGETRVTWDVPPTQKNTIEFENCSPQDTELIDDLWECLVSLKWEDDDED